MSAYARGQLFGDYLEEDGKTKANSGKQGLYKVILNHQPNSDYDKSSSKSGEAAYDEGNYSTDITPAIGALTLDTQFTPEPFDRKYSDGKEYEDPGEKRLYALPVNEDTIIVQTAIDDEHVKASFKKTSVGIMLCNK